MSHYDYLSPVSGPGLAGPVEDLMAVGVQTVAKSVGSSSNRDQAWDYFRFNKMGLSQTEKSRRIAEWRDLSTPFKAAMDGLKPFMFLHATFTDLKDFKLEDKLRLQADLKSKFDAEWAKVFRPASPAMTKAEAIEAAKKKARAQMEDKIARMRQKGIADAMAGRYDPPAPIPAPDYDTMNYQAGWMSTGAALPPGVALVGAGGVPGGGMGPSSTGSDDGKNDDGKNDDGKNDDGKFPIIPVAIAAAGLAAILLMRKK
jgi:hypothetical protein